MPALSAAERTPNLKTKTLLSDVNLRLIFSVVLVIMTGLNAITPAFPQMAQGLGVSEAKIGLLVTMYTLPGVLLAPLLGIFADRHGRKPLLVAALLVFGLAGGACALTSNFTLLLVLRFVQGIGLAPLFLLSLTIIGDLYQGPARTKAMGYNTTVIGISAALFPALGGWLASIDWHLPFALSLLAIPIGLMLLWKLKTPEPKNHQKLGDYLKGVLGSVKSREAIGLLILTAGSQLVLIGGFFTYLPMLLSSFGASALLIGVVLAARALSLSLSASFLGKLAERVSPRLLIKGSFVLAALSLAAVPLLGNPYLILIPAVLYGLAHGLNFPNAQALLTGAAPSEQRAAFLSLRSLVKRIGQTTGPLVMGGVYGVLGAGAVFYMSAGIVGVLLVVALVMLEN